MSIGERIVKARKHLKELGLVSKPDLKKTLEETFGTQGHPKADLLFDLVYENHHGSGWRDIFHAYQDYVNLLAPAEAYK